MTLFNLVRREIWLWFPFGVFSYFKNVLLYFFLTLQYDFNYSLSVEHTCSHHKFFAYPSRCTETIPDGVCFCPKSIFLFEEKKKKRKCISFVMDGATANGNSSCDVFYCCNVSANEYWHNASTSIYITDNSILLYLSLYATLRDFLEVGKELSLQTGRNKS